MRGRQWERNKNVEIRSIFVPFVLTHDTTTLYQRVTQIRKIGSFVLLSKALSRYQRCIVSKESKKSFFTAFPGFRSNHQTVYLESSNFHWTKVPFYSSTMCGYNLRMESLCKSLERFKPISGNTLDFFHPFNKQFNRRR